MSAPANFSASDFFPGITGIAASFTGKVRIGVQHLQRFVLGFLLSGVRGVAFRQLKFQRAQKELRAQLPAHNGIPLVHQHGQIAVGLNPLRPHVPDNRF